MPLSVLGLDIGGANLKAAHTSGVSRLQPFALWKTPDGLADALSHLLATLPTYDLLAVTMTGELCDCFETKRRGVLAILDAVKTIAGETPVRVWQNDGLLVDLDAAHATPLLAAAANWLALATFAGRFAPAGPALVIDIGSTTTDIIPLQDGKPCPRAFSDPERLQYQELVYTGVRRTPLCALLGREAAAELFATTLDAYLVNGDLPEDPTDKDTADGRPATISAAHARLARMLCADGETCPKTDTHRLAWSVRARQMHLVRTAVDRVASFLVGKLAAVIHSGSGEFLVREILELPPGYAVRRVSLAEKLGPELSHSACAYALAVLTEEQAVVNSGKILSPMVIKVGGSLFDLPNLGARLQRWLERLPSHAVLLIPGGGSAADVVRDLDQRHALGEERAHWLALFSLSFNARILAELVPNAVVVQDLAACAGPWRAGKIPVLDPYPFALADEGQPGALPHSWTATSDSLAARVAKVAGACRLILLKSVALPEPVDWELAGRLGQVDSFFTKAATGLDVQVVNFRDWQP